MPIVTAHDVQLHSAYQLLVSMLMVLKTQSEMGGSKNCLKLTVSMPSLPCHNVLDRCNLPVDLHVHHTNPGLHA